jgi:DNA-binding NarL/FixJ family response regulator
MEYLKDIQDRVDSLAEHTENIDVEVEELIKENNELKALIETYNKHYVHLSKVRNGAKIAKRTDIKKEDIQKLKQQGYSNIEIADKLNCSRATVWRRLNKKDS